MSEQAVAPIETQTPPVVEKIQANDPAKQEATTEKSSVVEPTKEEIEIRKKKFLFGMGYGEDPAPQEKPAPEPEKKAEEPKKEEPKAEEPKKEEPKPKKKKAQAPPAESPDLDTIAATAEAVATKIAEKLPKPTETKVDLDLSDKEKATLSVLKAMEESNASYKGIADKTIKFWKREADYAESWMKENPGKKFNPSDEEHAQFYEAHEPSYDQDDFESAKDRIKEAEIERRIEQKLEKKYGAKNAEDEFRGRVQAALPKIQLSAQSAVVDMIKAASPEMAKMLDPNDKQGVSPEVVKKLEEADPVALEVLNANAERLRILTHELEMLTNFSDKYQQKMDFAVPLQSSGGKSFILPHRELVDFSLYLEKEIASMDPEQTVRDGKRFITQADFNSNYEYRVNHGMTPKDALAWMNRRVWTLETEDIKNALVAHYAEDSRREIDRRGSTYEKRQASKLKSEANGQSQKKEENVEQAQAGVAKPKPPSTSNSSDKTNVVKPAVDETEDRRKRIMEVMWGS